MLPEATKNREMENRVSSIISIVNQDAEIDNDDVSRQFPENHAKIDEIRKFWRRNLTVIM